MNPLTEYTVTATRAGKGWDVALFRAGVPTDIVHTQLRPRVVKIGVQRKALRIQLLELQKAARPADKEHIEAEIRVLTDTPVELIEIPRIYEYGSRPAVMTRVWNRMPRAVEMLGFVEVQL